MTSAPINPSPNRSLPPRFDELGDKEFEHLCRALLDKEQHLVNVDFYGVRGQKQFGIDIIGHRNDDSGTEVVSCKCYRSVHDKDLGTFSDDFLKHLDTHWKGWRIGRFVLAVAADTDRTEVQKAVLAEVERFMALGIRYQVWNPAKLQELLRPHPGIVRQYLGEYWVPQICGRSEPVETPRSDALTLIDAAVATQLAALQEKLAGRTSARIAQALDRIRSGERSAVEAELLAIRNEAVEWSSLMPDARARLLRLLASCHLDRDDISGAEALADEADVICLAEEPRLRTLIARYRDGTEAALTALGEPITQDGANLRVALSIEAADFAAAERMLDEHPLLRTPDAETWRLRAYLLFERNEREKAVAAIGEAERLKPDWLRVREDGARLRYAAAVSHSLRPATLRVPNPIDLDLIKEDAASRRLLDEAISAFTVVLERSTEEDERTDIETWRLATLSARRDRLDEAAAYARDLLDHDPTHWGAIAWSLARGFPLDKQAALTAIEFRLGDRTAEPPHMAAAMLLCLSDENLDEARRLFGHYSGQFETEDGKALMAQWGQRFRAEESEEKTERPMALRVEEIVERARLSCNWAPINALLADVARNEASFVLPICQSLAAAGRWDDIAPHIDTLTDNVATAEAMRLACYAANYSGKPKRALALIARYSEFVANGELPIDLKRLEIDALAATGETVAALARSEKLRTATSEPHDVIREAELAFGIGDAKRAETLIGRPEIAAALPARTALVWAGRLKSQNPARATQLLNHAIDKGVEREAVVSAFHLALHLPDPEIVRRIAPAFHSLAHEDKGTGLIRSFSLDEVAKIVVADRENAERLSSMHNKGEIPTHLVSDRLKDNFAHLYLRSGDEDPAVPFRRRLSPLWIRHGARPAVTLPDGDIFASSLYIDISSLLLAEGIGLLDILDRTGIGLRLPNTLPQALSALEYHASDHQPDIIAAHRKIRQAVASGSITVRSGDDIAHPADDRAWRIVHDKSDDDATTLDNRGIPVVPLSALHTALRALGEIDGVGPTGERVSSDTLPDSGDILFFEFNTIASAIDRGLFDAAVRRYRIEIERRYLEHIDAELAAFERNRELVQRLARLRERTLRHIQSGTWQLALIREMGGDEEMYDRPTAVERCLLDLLRVPAEEQAVIWIDDRSVSRYENTETHPLIGISDVLAALRTAERLNDDQYYEFLLKLRRSRAHFLPMAPEEALHHLKKAVINDEGVVETPALRTLRQHFADALSLEEFWDFPPPDGQEAGNREIHFALGLWHLFDNLLPLVWAEENAALRQRMAWLDWAWSALRVYRFQRLPLVGEVQGKRTVASMEIAFLFSSAITLFDANPGPRQQEFRELSRWLDERALQPACRSGQADAKQVARPLAHILIEHYSGKDEDNDIRHDLHISVRRFVDSLPNTLRRSLYEIPEFVAEFDIVLVSTVNFEDIAFEEKAFWAAIAQIRSGVKAHLTSADESQKVTFSLPTRGATDFIRVTGDIEFRLAKAPEFDLVGGSSASRRRLLKRHPKWFDMPPDRRAEAIAEIADAPTPSERMRLLRHHQAHSITYRLGRWISTIREHETLQLSTPVPADLLRYLRLDIACADPYSALTHAADRLTAELGAAEAMRRLGYLPIPLPLSVVGGIAAMGTSERTKCLARGPAGPIVRLQWLRLLRHFEYPDFVTEVDRTLEDWEPCANAFLSVLRWANGDLAESANWRSLSGPYRLLLTWTYAGLLTETFLGEGVSPNFVIQHFGITPPILPLELILVSDRTYDDSILFPSHVTDRASILYHGMAMVVGTDGERLLTTAQRQRIEALTRYEHEETRRPMPSLYRDWRLFDDPFGTMFSMRPAGIFDTLPDLTDEEAEQAILKCLSGIGAVPTSSNAWVGYLVAGGMPAFENPEVLKTLAALDVKALAATDAGNGFALRMAAEATARSRDMEEITRFADGLFAGAATLAGRFPTPVYPPGPVEHPAQKAAVHLIEALAQLSKRPDLSSATAFLADSLLKLAAAWPSATPYWRHVAEEVLNRLPFEVTSEMVKTWTILRTEA